MNRERYIDRVLDLIIKDTQIDKKDLRIVYPFNQPLYALQTNFYLPLHRNFYDYCKDQYGLTLVECKELWYRYSDSINYDFSDSINEVYTFGSLEHTDWDVREILGKYGYTGEGHYKFFMRVYHNIVNSIEIRRSDGTVGNWEVPDTLYIREFRHTNHSVLGLSVHRDGDPDENFKLFSKLYTEYIFKGCISLLTEGLGIEGNYVSIMLVDMVMEYIYKTIFKNNSLNESEDRMDRFVDKVLQFLKDDTYQIGEDLIRVPFLDQPVSISYKSKRVHTVIEIIMFIEEPPKPFTHYCIETYGLDSQIINLLWIDYRVFLMENFHRLKKTY
jgi:hypothetical protein